MARESVRLGREILARGGASCRAGAEGAEGETTAGTTTAPPPLLYQEHAGDHEIPGKALADLAEFLQGVLASPRQPPAASGESPAPSGPAQQQRTTTTAHGGQQ